MAKQDISIKSKENSMLKIYIKILDYSKLDQFLKEINKVKIMKKNFSKLLRQLIKMLIIMTEL